MTLIQSINKSTSFVPIYNKKEEAGKLDNSNAFAKKIMIYTHRTIVVKETNYIHLIHLLDIIFIQSSSNYSTIYLKNNKKIVTSKTLKYWEKIIDHSYFIRCHNSYLINYNFIKTVDIQNNEILMGHISIPVSRLKKAHLMSYF